MQAVAEASPLRVRWLLVTLVVLLIASVVIPLTGGTGLPGLVAAIPLFAATEVLHAISEEQRAQANVPRSLRDLHDDALIMRNTYAGQEVVGRIVTFDPETLHFE